MSKVVFSITDNQVKALELIAKGKGAPSATPSEVRTSLALYERGFAVGGELTELGKATLRLVSTLARPI